MKRLLRPAWQMLKQAARWGDLKRTPYGLTPLALIMAAGLLSQFRSSVLGVAGPNIRADLDVNLQTIVGVVSIVGILGLALSPLAGWLGERTRRTWMYGAGLVIGGITGTLFARVTGTPSQATSQMVGIQSVGAVGANLADVPSFSLLADYFPQSARGRVFAVLSVVGTGGGLLAFGLSGLAAVHFGWRAAAAAPALGLVVLGAVVIIYMREPIRGYFEKRAMGLSEAAASTPDQPQSFGEAWRSTWAVRTLRRLFFADLIEGIGGTASVTFFPFLLADYYRLDLSHRLLYQLAPTLMAVVGGILGGGMLDVLSSRAPSSVLRLTSSFSFIGAIGVLLIGFQPPLWALLAFSCLLTFGSSLAGPARGAIYTQVIPPSIRTQGIQVINLAAIPGQIALIVFLTIQTEYGYQPIFWTASVFAVLAAIIQLSAADFFETDRRNQLAAATASEEARKLRTESAGRLLMCRGLNVSYDGNQVLFGVDLEVKEGEILALLGTNGAGKSTLLRAISGIREASDGVVFFDGVDITHKPPHEIAALGLVQMPGGRGIFPDLTVDESLRLGTWLADRSSAPGLLSQAYEVFPRLRALAGRRAAQLSGGEQQMVSLAQAFMARPRLLMIDELTLGLAPAVVGELIQMVRRISEEGATVIVVEQSVNVALTIAERAVFMEKGEVRFTGSTQELMRRPDILRAVYVKGTAGISVTSDTRGLAKKRRLQELGEAREILSVQGVAKRYGGVVALEDVDLTLREGEVLGLIGPNGSGKTTLLEVISGYVSPDQGTVSYAGVDITSLPPHERARLGLVRRFQDARLFPTLTVHENLMVALDRRLEFRNAFLGALGVPQVRRAERRARDRADKLIELLELGAYRDKFASELSTGLRRIADLAFVLATEPRLLLLDEPSSGIAQAEAESLGPLLSRVRHETGCAILIVEHDIPLISRVADELVAMVTGRVVRRGPAAEVLDDPAVIDAFLGTSEAAVRRSGALA